MTRHRHQSLVQVFRVPALLAILSLFGLVASLVGDGAWDWLGAGALMVPGAIGLARIAGPRPPRQGWKAAAVPARRRSFS